MNKTSFNVLNQPFVLWFLSSIVVALVSWQYTEIQNSSSAHRAEEQILRRANLELKLILQDIQFGVEQKENITLGHINATLVKMQYNASSPTNQFYFATLQNIMLEIDSRNKAEGLEKYQREIFSGVKTLSNIFTREAKQFTNPSTKVWVNLTSQERESLNKLSNLSENILSYYQGYYGS